MARRKRGGHNTGTVKGKKMTSEGINQKNTNLHGGLAPRPQCPRALLSASALDGHLAPCPNAW